MNIAIVTNSYHREKSLVERSLRASLKQVPSVQHVIFIDQNDARLDLAPDIAQDNRLQHLHVQVNCVSKARNSFAIPSGCDWLIFCDDDGFLAPDYISRFMQITQQHPEWEVIAGSIVRDDNNEYYSPRHKIGGSLRNFRHTKLLMGSNFACRSNTFKRLRGFDEEFGVGSKWGSGEESDFAWKAFFSNTPMEYQRELIVYHIRPYAGALLPAIKKANRYGIGKGALVAKWLLVHRRATVLFELAEMMLVPLAQIVISIITLKFSQVAIYLGTLGGRLLGLCWYPLEKAGSFLGVSSI